MYPGFLGGPRGDAGGHIIFVVALVNDLREVSGPAKVAARSWPAGSCRCSGSL
jgi:hypothetical protein